MNEIDTEQIRRIVSLVMQEQMTPYRAAINRITRDLYGENPDGSRSNDGGLIDLTKRNNVLLWVVIVISTLNFIALGAVLFLTR